MSGLASEVGNLVHPQDSRAGDRFRCFRGKTEAGGRRVGERTSERKNRVSSSKSERRPGTLHCKATKAQLQSKKRGSNAYKKDNATADQGRRCIGRRSRDGECANDEIRWVVVVVLVAGAHSRAAAVAAAAAATRGEIVRAKQVLAQTSRAAGLQPQDQVTCKALGRSAAVPRPVLQGCANCINREIVHRRRHPRSSLHIRTPPKNVTSRTI